MQEEKEEKEEKKEQAVQQPETKETPLSVLTILTKSRMSLCKPESTSVWDRTNRLIPSGITEDTPGDKLYSSLYHLEEVTFRSTSNGLYPPGVWFAESMTQTVTNRVTYTLKGYRKWLFQDKEQYWQTFALVYNQLSQTEDQLDALSADVASCYSRLLLPLCMNQLLRHLHHSYTRGFTNVESYICSLLDNLCTFMDEDVLKKPISLPGKEWMSAFLDAGEGEEEESSHEKAPTSALWTDPSNVQEWTQLCLDVLFPSV